MTARVVHETSSLAHELLPERMRRLLAAGPPLPPPIDCSDCPIDPETGLLVLTEPEPMDL